LASTGDGLALSIGEGGKGLGVSRDTGIGGDAVEMRVPRNAPHLFNLGAKEYVFMFHDGRVTVDNSLPSGFNTPAGEQLPLGLANPLAAQAMIPVTSDTEMAGQTGENPVADAAAEGALAGENGVWSLLAQRLRAIPEYVALFQDAYPEQITTADDIKFKDAANAIAAFEATAWRADNSRYDQYLRGNNHALTVSEVQGMKLFYGKANCSLCHSGKFQTDHSFHAIAMPQIGPGKGHNSEGYSDGREDFGREAVTGDVNDRFRFRTPGLRNVALTAPYGHDGAFDTLEAVVRHHLNPVESLLDYDTSQVLRANRTPQ
jgi:cytochrome c peroxidase